MEHSTACDDEEKAVRFADAVGNGALNTLGGLQGK
jgi:hypothetical protein